MRRILLLSLGLLISHGALADSSLWTDLGASNSGLAARGTLDSDRYNSSRQLTLDESGILNVLEGAPAEPVGGLSARSESAVTISLPLPDGSFAEVQVYDSPVMESGLASELPAVKTWSVVGTDGKVLSGRIGHTDHGFHATLTMASGDAVYIDAEDIDQERLYHSISHSDNIDSAGQFTCGVEGHDHSDAQNILSGMAFRGVESVTKTVGNKIREYRIAIATTQQFAEVAGGTTDSVAASVAVVVNRLNEVYQRDAGIKFKLVNNNNDLIFGASDAGTRAPQQPYTTSNSGTMLDDNQVNVDAAIGNGNYDVAQVFHFLSRFGSEGLAVSPSACRDSVKAKGLSGFSRYLDGFAASMVAHELAHQFDASHSFNGTALNCNQRSATTPYEPGGGTTIMSYAGVCDVDDVQSNSNPYFHGGSIKQIVEYATNGDGNSCGTLLDVTNTTPVADAGDDFTIPKETPFVLPGSGTDPDGDTLTYSWEQFNVSTAANLSEGDTGSNAIINSKVPTTESNRFIPSRLSLASGTPDVGEVLPTQARSGDNALKMILTVRDQKSGVDVDEMTVAVSSEGPFEITSHTTTSILNPGDTPTITWDTAGTETSCPAVAMLLVTGDPTYGETVETTILAEGVTNNGSAMVTIPAGTPSTDSARFSVACENNIFYALSKANLGIQQAAQGANVDTLYTVSDVQQVEGTLGLSHLKFRVNITPSQGTTKRFGYRIAHIDTDISDFAFGTFNNSDNLNPFTTTSAVIPTVDQGATYHDIYIPIATDEVHEANETFKVEILRLNTTPNLSFESNPAVPISTAIMTIVDDEPVTASVSAGAGGETGTNVAFTVSLDKVPSNPVSVAYATSSSTAASGTDFTATTGTLEFAAGVQSLTVNVPVIDDDVFEGDETLNLTLSSPSTGLLFADGASTIVGIGTITDNEAQPTLTISDVSVPELDAGTSLMTFTVELSGKAQSDVTVKYITSGGTATPVTDYIAVPETTLTILAGQLSNTFTVTINGDEEIENDETFNVTLSAATVASIADTTAVGTIQNDEITPVQATIANVSVEELDTGTALATFTVTLSAKQTIPVSVDFTTVDGTAVATSDYVANSGTLNFPVDTTTADIVVAVSSDTIFEATEQYTVQLSNPSIGVEFAGSVATLSAEGTITDNDTAPTLSISDQAAVEGSALEFTVSLTGQAQSDVTVLVTIEADSAVEGTDYTALAPTTLTFETGQTSKTVTVNSLGNNVADGTKTFNAKLSSPTIATITKAVGLGTIQDDEIITASIAAAETAEGNAGGNNQLEFVVTLSSAATGAMSVSYNTADGAATGVSATSADYTPVVNGTLSFALNETSKSIYIDITGDATPEDHEVMTVTLSGATPSSDIAVSTTAGSATGTITNDDPHLTVNASITSPGAVAEGNSGETDVTFNINLDAASTQVVTVDYTVAAGDTDASDITGAGGTHTFQAGETSKEVIVKVIGDTAFETDESFTVTLTGATGAITSPGAAITAGQDVGTATITNDDDNKVSISGGTFSEDAGTVQLTLTLEGQHTGATDLTVKASTVAGSAGASDYTPIVDQVVTFTNGDTSQTIDVAITDDAANELTESFTVSLSEASTGLAIDGGPATVNITDNDTSTVSIESVSVVEGSVGGTSQASFKVNVSPTSASPITVTYSTADGTAEAGSDYTVNATNTIIIPANTASGMINVGIVGDGVFEADETFTATLTNAASDQPVVLHASDVTGTATITNDDNNLVSIEDATVSEGVAGGKVTLTLTLAGEHAGPANTLTVNVSTANVLNGADSSDYTALTNQVVTFANGDTTQTVDIFINDDAANESNETFVVNLSGESTGLTIDDGTATVTITDNDTSTVSIDPTTLAVSVAEGDSATTAVSIKVNVTPTSAAPITVDYTTANGSAEAGSDYTAITGSIEIPANTAQGTITIDVSGDTVVELDETFTVTLTNVTSGQPAQLSSTDLVATATITNDDKSKVSVSDVAAVEGVGLVFNVTLDQPSLTDLSVDYATTDGTATVAGADYTAATGNLAFAAGDITKTVTVATTTDIVTEDNETMTMTLTIPAGVTELLIDGGTATGTITNDDTNSDGDTLSDAQEEIAGTDPQKTDTDGDGTDDAVEVGSDINNPTDSDGDGVIDALESGAEASDNASLQVALPAATAAELGLNPGDEFTATVSAGAQIVSCSATGSGSSFPITTETSSDVSTADPDFEFPNGLFHVCVTTTGATTTLTLTYPDGATVVAGSVIRILTSGGVWETLTGGTVSGRTATFTIEDVETAPRNANRFDIDADNDQLEVIAGIAKRSIVTGNATSGGGSMSLISLMFLSMFTLLCVARRRRSVTQR